MNRRHLLRWLGGSAMALPLIGRTAERMPLARSMLVLDSRIAGFAYYHGSNCLQQLAVGDALTVLREPENSHDENAVALYWQGKQLGYVPRVSNRALSRLLDEGRRVQANIRVVDADSRWEPLYFEVYVLV